MASAFNILHVIVHMKKVAASWAPKMFTHFQIQGMESDESTKH